MLNPDIRIKNVRLLCKLLVLSPRLTNPEIDLKMLLEGIDSHKNKSAKELTVLIEHLEENFNVSIAPLFDKTALYLANNVPPALLKQTKEVITAFYRAVNNQGKLAKSIIDDPEMAALLSFESKTEENRNRRTIFMHLFHQQVLVTEGSNNNLIEWTSEHNESLLQEGFATYIKHAKTILDANPADPRLANNRDLTVSQQHGLLQLTDELAIIGKPKIIVQPLQELNIQIDTLLNRYQSSWWPKSIDRTLQSSDLKENLQNIFNANDIGAAHSKYEFVLQALHAAKLQAIDHDFEANKGRSWFKLNRSGNSRYLNTLNQMHDMVIRHWTQDLSALQGFQVYKAVNVMEFQDLAKRLHQAVVQHRNETYPDASDVRSTSISKRISRFFKDDSMAKKRIELLEADINGFNISEPPRTLDQINKLISALRGSLTHLPGHLVISVNDLLARGDSLSSHFEEQGKLEGLRKLGTGSDES